MTEGVAWLLVCLGVVIGGIAWGILVAESRNLYGDTAVPTLWLTLGFGLAGMSFVPALILTGIRELMPNLRGVLRGE